MSSDLLYPLPFPVLFLHAVWSSPVYVCVFLMTACEVKSWSQRIMDQNRAGFPKSISVLIHCKFVEFVHWSVTVDSLSSGSPKKTDKHSQKHKQTLENLADFCHHHGCPFWLLAQFIYNTAQSSPPCLVCWQMPQKALEEGEEGVPRVISYPGPNPWKAGEPQCKKWPSTDLPRPWPLAHPLTNDHTLD